MYKKLCIGIVALYLNNFVAMGETTDSFEDRLGRMQFDEKDYPVPEIVLGKENAKYTLMIYSSFSCSHCRLLHKTLPQFIREHVDNGEVRLTLRFFVDDPAAFEAAMLVVYFGRDRPYAMLRLTKLIYDNQEEWIRSKNQPEFLRNLFANFMQKRYPRNEGYWYQQANHLLTMPNKNRPEMEKISQKINARLMHGQQWANRWRISSIPALLFNVRFDKNLKITHGKIHEGIMTLDEIWDACKKYDIDVKGNTKEKGL